MAKHDVEIWCNYVSGPPWGSMVAITWPTYFVKCQLSAEEVFHLMKFYHNYATLYQRGIEQPIHFSLSLYSDKIDWKEVMPLVLGTDGVYSENNSEFNGNHW